MDSTSPWTTLWGRLPTKAVNGGSSAQQKMEEHFKERSYNGSGYCYEPRTLKLVTSTDTDADPAPDPFLFLINELSGLK
jgi:hypothetical protein